MDEDRLEQIELALAEVTEILNSKGSSVTLTISDITSVVEQQSLYVRRCIINKQPATIKGVGNFYIKCGRLEANETYKRLSDLGQTKNQIKARLGKQRNESQIKARLDKQRTTKRLEAPLL